MSMELCVRQKNNKIKLVFQPGKSVKEIIELSETDIRIRTGCHNNGACGLCLIRVVSGDAGALTESEKIHLDNNNISAGIRLACQAIPKTDLEIEVIATERLFSWKVPIEKRTEHVKADQPVNESVGKLIPGVAVDLGTTHLRISLIDTGNGKILQERYCKNPQLIYGSDIMTRLQMASENETMAKEMSEMVLEAIGKGIWEMSTAVNIDPSLIEKVIMVGNTVMLALLSLKNYKKLLEPASWGTTLDCIPENTSEWAKELGISSKGEVILLPPVAGFVGSDIIAGIYESGIIGCNNCELFIDFGTNSEVALWDGARLWMTSAAGGPAFEGSGISCGVPAEPGALYRFKDNQDKFKFDVIPGAEIKGICGSGLIDLFASLIHIGKLNEMGQLMNDQDNKILIFEETNMQMYLLKQDIDLFQRAKAAIGAAVQALLEKSGKKIPDLMRVSIAGAFGKYLDLKNAITIGLLPDIPEDRFILQGNTALKGSEKFLMSYDAQKNVNKIKSAINYINLSQFENFESLFFDNLFLKKMDGEP